MFPVSRIHRLFSQSCRTWVKFSGSSVHLHKKKWTNKNTPRPINFRRRVDSESTHSEPELSDPMQNTPGFWSNTQHLKTYKWFRSSWNTSARRWNPLFRQERAWGLTLNLGKGSDISVCLDQIRRGRGSRNSPTGGNPESWGPANTNPH